MLLVHASREDLLVTRRSDDIQLWVCGVTFLVQFADELYIWKKWMQLVQITSNSGFLISKRSFEGKDNKSFVSFYHSDSPVTICWIVGLQRHHWDKTRRRKNEKEGRATVKECDWERKAEKLNWDAEKKTDCIHSGMPSLRSVCEKASEIELRCGVMQKRPFSH